MRNYIILLSVLLLISCNKPSIKEIHVKTNKNIETLAILYLLSDIGLNAHEGSLASEAKQYFYHYQNHKVVSLFKQFNDTVGFPMPSDLFLRLQEFPNAKLPTNVYTDSSKVIIGKHQYGLGKEFVHRFILALNNFYEEAGVEGFINAHKLYFDQCIQEVEQNLPNGELITTMELYFGKEFSSYTIIPSPILFPQIGFGIKIDGEQEDIYYIAGSFPQDKNGSHYTYGFDSASDVWEMSVHEFGHSFINPLCARTVNKKRIDTLRHLFDPIESKMKNQGYSDWWICFTEHIVRMGEIRIAMALKDSIRADKLRDTYIHEMNFVYLPYLENKMKYYENNRDKYQTIEEYFPELIDGLSEVDTVQIKE